jgi:organic hydroperoxide reductase OsmC/OhrA
MSSTPSPVHVFQCRLVWTGATPEGTASIDTYSRAYRVDFEGKPSLTGTAAPAFRGDPSLHNPEDLLMAALSACHCLTYLALCARAGIRVLSYEDGASGTMQLVDRVMRFTEVTLHPRVTVAAGTDMERARALHEKAHAGCFIANSVNFPVRNEPTITAG